MIVLIGDGQLLLHEGYIQKSAITKGHVTKLFRNCQTIQLYYIAICSINKAISTTRLVCDSYYVIFIYNCSLNTRFSCTYITVYKKLLRCI